MDALYDLEETSFGCNATTYNGTISVVSLWGNGLSGGVVVPCRAQFHFKMFSSHRAWCTQLHVQNVSFQDCTGWAYKESMFRYTVYIAFILDAAVRKVSRLTVYVSSRKA